MAAGEVFDHRFRGRLPFRGKTPRQIVTAILQAEVLGACVVEATRGSTVRPAPVNEWRRSYEFTA